MKNGVDKEYFSNLDHNELKEPLLFQIFVVNDDFTPMEFVVNTLEMHFYMDRKQATDTMFEAHISGRALCGIFSKDFAESKVSQVVEHARINEHPLICSMEAA